MIRVIFCAVWWFSVLQQRPLLVISENVRRTILNLICPLRAAVAPAHPVQQDGGECGTEGKAQPEIIINLLGCEAFDCRVTQLFVGVSPVGLRSGQIRCLSAKRNRKFIEIRGRRISQQHVYVDIETRWFERTVFSSTPAAGRAAFTSQPSYVSCLNVKAVVLFL